MPVILGGNVCRLITIGTGKARRRKGTIAMKQSLIVLGCVCLGAVVLVNNRSLRAWAKYSTASTQESINIRDSFLAHTTPGAGTTVPVKLCGAVHALSFSWRETVVAPDNWKAATCQNFANSLGGSHYQLGCANPSSFSWGNKDGSLPADNQCRW
jgi:hypothetical protein